MNYSEEIVNAIKDHLENAEMKLVAFDEDGDFGFTMHIPGPISFVQYIIRVHNECYTVFANCPIAAESNNSSVMSTLSEFINMANFGLRNGNFEMDYRDGEIRYKCHVDCGEQAPCEDTIRRSIAIPASVFKRYSRGLIGVLFTGMSAKAAVEMCENEEQTVQGTVVERVGLRSALADMPRKRHEEHSDSDAETEGEHNPELALPSFEEFMEMDDSADEIQDNGDNSGTADEPLCSDYEDRIYNEIRALQASDDMNDRSIAFDLCGILGNEALNVTFEERLNIIGRKLKDYYAQRDGEPKE